MDAPFLLRPATIAKKVGVGVMRNGDQRREREREREGRLKGDRARVRETIQKEGAAADAADADEAKK